MKWIPSGLLFGLLLLSAASAQAGEIQPKVLLHVSAPTTKSTTICTSWSPNEQGIPCSDYVVEGPTGQNLLVYLVIGQFPVPNPPVEGNGVGGVSLGIEYNGANQEGVDVFGWTMCADGLEFPNAGSRGEWPASGAGNTVTWLNCPQTSIGFDGGHAVVGAFSLYAYSADQLKVTPNRNLLSGSALVLAKCSGLEIHPDTTWTVGRAGFGVPGYNPCTAFEPCPPVLVQAMDVDPNTLNAASHGNYVTAHIELPPAYDVALVNPASIRLNALVIAFPDFFQIGDWNKNGIQDFMVRFSRSDVEGVLQEGDSVPVTITGSVGACSFSGVDVVRVIRPHLVHPNGGESYLAGSRTLIEWENPTGWTPEYAQVHYSGDGGETWSLIADHVLEQSYVWAAPVEPTQSGRLRVVLVDEQGVMGYDTTDGPFAIRTATGIDEGTLPVAHRLYPNSPNPSQGATRTAFDLPEPGEVRIRILDLNGRAVRVLTDSWYPAGHHEVSWNARDISGDPVSAGIYFIHMQAGSFAGTQRMYLRK